MMDPGLTPAQVRNRSRKIKHAEGRINEELRKMLGAVEDVSEEWIVRAQEEVRDLAFNLNVTLQRRKQK